MPLSAHFLAVTPDGCPEEIEAGPFTEERAKDALFAWELNHGCPARVVALVEDVACPTRVDLMLIVQNILDNTESVSLSGGRELTGYAAGDAHLSEPAHASIEGPLDAVLTMLADDLRAEEGG